MANDKEVLAKADWAGEQGNRWLANVDRLETMLAPIGEALLSQASFMPGERVIDIGCGGGSSTRSIAASVSPDGGVLGVDIAANLLDHAEGQSCGSDNVRYQCADAAAMTLTGEPFDRLHSRFGSMFFDDPHSAFANLHSLLKPRARIDLAVWAHPRENPWMMEMIQVARKHIDVPPAEPRAPGPFAFEDLDYLGEILSAGGFSKMNAAPYHGQQAIVGADSTPEDATRFVLSSFGVGQIINQQADDIRAATTADMQAMFKRHFTPDKGVILGCKAWLVSAIA